MNRTSEQEVAILVNGKPIRTIAHNGNLYIVAKEGAQYEVRLSNHSTSRVLGVCSVDGLNVIDGTSADINGAGYIINGYGSYQVKGFRTSNEKVHPFKFAKKAKSYAAKSEEGDVQNCGVIGIAFHAEKRKPEPIRTIIKHEHHYHDDYWPYYPFRPYRPYRPYWGDWYSCSGTGQSGTTYTASTGGMQMSSGSNQMQSRSANLSNAGDATTIFDCSFDMGTQFSQESVADAVQTSTFEKDHILCQFEIYYASEKVLRKMGIPVDKASAVAFPNSFPKGFCKPPQK